MKSQRPKTAEANFREAFERLKIGKPKVLPPDAQVSQNNVAKEAGCDPSALRKSRFPSLIAEIQNYVAAHGGEVPESERQKLLKQRQRSRAAREMVADCKNQRDAAAGLLVEAHAQIAILTRRLIDAEARIDALRPKDGTIQSSGSRPKISPRGVDTIGLKKDKK